MKVTEIVKAVLMTKPETRNSDYWLWLEVIKTDLSLKGNISALRNWSIENFLTFGFNLVPHFETVGRIRRRLQAKYPELKGAECVQEGRKELEEQYREFARDEQAL